MMNIEYYLIGFLIIWFSSGFVMSIIIFLYDGFKIKEITNKDLGLLFLGTFMGFVSVGAGAWFIFSDWMDNGKTKYLFKKNEKK